jgi:glycosyltransferase involved in cell wall biosynthesis
MQVASGQIAADRLGRVAPFISVVTVSLNAASSIEDTIASVCMQQTDFAVEHICVDGGSVDETRTIIDRWAERSEQIVRIYEPDAGIFDAMNKGLRAAKGEYVLFLNSDDFLVGPDVFAKTTAGLSQGAVNNPNLIVGNVSMGQLGHWGFWRHRRVPRLLGRFQGCGLYPLHQAQFTSRKLITALGGFDSTRRIASDVIQYYALERELKLSIRFLPCDIAFMRDGGAANADWKARWRATAELYEYLRSVHSPIRAACMISVKTLQSFTELRFGSCPHTKWFAPAGDGSTVAD